MRGPSSSASFSVLEAFGNNAERKGLALKRYGGQLSRDDGSAKVGAGYGDRTRLTGFLNLVMARDFWHQGLDRQWVVATQPFTGVRSILLQSPGGLETFWTRSSFQRGFLEARTAG